jgi:hypothetical protein
MCLQIDLVAFFEDVHMHLAEIRVVMMVAYKDGAEQGE